MIERDGADRLGPHHLHGAHGRGGGARRRVPRGVRLRGPRADLLRGEGLSPPERWLRPAVLRRRDESRRSRRVPADRRGRERGSGAASVPARRGHPPPPPGAPAQRLSPTGWRPDRRPAKKKLPMDGMEGLALANKDYVAEQYRRWQADPHSVDESWALFFAGFE